MGRSVESLLTHSHNLRFRMTGFVILVVERSITEHEVREQSSCSNFHRITIQVIVGITRFEVNPIIHLENGDRENCRLTISHTGIDCFQCLTDNQPSCIGSICAEVNRAEWPSVTV